MIYVMEWIVSEINSLYISVTAVDFGMLISISFPQT